MGRVLRFDLGELAPPEKLDNGWLRVEGKIARIGIQEYEDASGTVHRELRLPDEVFDAASLHSFEMVPLTNTHPPVLLDDKNTKSYQVGHAGQVIRRDGDFVVAPLLITDAQAILAAKVGRSQLSNGYSCELDSTQDPTLTEQWGAYDFIQRKIRGNHIALVDAARAGPEARVRLDSGAARMVDPSGQRAPAPTTEPERTTMKTLRIDSINIDAEAPDAQAVIDRTLAAIKERSDAALSSATKRADAAEKKVSVVKGNALKLVSAVGVIREKWDAMKARMVPCEECDGEGQVPGDDGKPVACGYCDGKGEYRMHDAVKAMTSKEEGPDGDDDDEMDMEEAVAGAETDEDELEAEQATEQEAGKASKKDEAKTRRRAKERKDAKRERDALRQRRADSRDRQLRRAMSKRLDLETNARRYLDEEDVSAADLAKLDDVGVMKAIVKKLAPEAKLDGKTPVEIRARYDAEIERAPQFTPEAARDMALRSLPTLGAAPRQDGDPRKAREAYLKRLDEQGKAKRQAAAK